MAQKERKGKERSEGGRILATKDTKNTKKTKAGGRMENEWENGREGELGGGRDGAEAPRFEKGDDGRTGGVRRGGVGGGGRGRSR